MDRQKREMTPAEMIRRYGEGARVLLEADRQLDQEERDGNNQRWAMAIMQQTGARLVVFEPIVPPRLPWWRRAVAWLRRTP